MAMKTILNMKFLSLLSKKSENLEDNHAKKMNKLEKRLEALSNRSNFQEVGVVRLYPIEWDSAPCPHRF